MFAQWVDSNFQKEKIEVIVMSDQNLEEIKALLQRILEELRRIREAAESLDRRYVP
jgi:hypothetical protein